MKEKKYTVIDNTCVVLARGMTLDDALMFMKAYCEKYFMEHIRLELQDEEGEQDGKTT